MLHTADIYDYDDGTTERAFSGEALTLGDLRRATDGLPDDTPLHIGQASDRFNCKIRLAPVDEITADHDALNGELAVCLLAFPQEP